MFNVTYGKQTFETATDAVTIFALPLVRGTDWKKKQAINSMFRKEGRSHSNMAARDGFEDHGKWFGAAYSTPESGATVLCLQLTRRVRGTVKAQCVMHVIPHEQGPMLSIRACVTPNDNSTQGDSVCVFAGCGYIIDHAQLTQLGIVMMRADIAHFMDAEELDDEFDIENMHSGKVPDLPNLMQIEDADGTVSAVIAAPVSRRKLRIRKR